MDESQRKDSEKVQYTKNIYTRREASPHEVLRRNREDIKIMKRVYDNANRPATEDLDCVVRAFTITSGYQYMDVHDMFERLGRKWGNGFRWSRSGTWSDFKRVPLLVENHIPLELKPLFRRCYLDKNFFSGRTHKRLTINQFVETYSRGKYAIMIQNHVTALINGILHDIDRLDGSEQIIAAWERK